MRIFAILVLLFSSVASAQPIKWTLNNVIFSDGGTASGSFFYDAETNTVSEVNIVTEGGDPTDTTPPSFYWLGPTTYTEGAMDNSLLLELETNIGSDWKASLIFWFSDPEDSSVSADPQQLTTSGGVYNIANHPNEAWPEWRREFIYEIDCVTSCGSGDRQSAKRYIVSGTVSAVPLPAAFWLFASGIGLLGWVKRKNSNA